MIPRPPLIPKSEFVGLEGIAHLCTGGEAPWLSSNGDAVRRFGELKSAGMAGREQIFGVCARAKASAAGLLGIPPDRVAFLSSASEGINQAIAAIDWRPGDNAVAGRLEYPSLLYPAARLRQRGVELRLVDSPGHYLSLDALAACVDSRTRLVLVSHVSYLTGQRLDLHRCAEIARSRGALLLVDATHGLGIAPVDGRACDFVVSSCYKWLLATHGLGIFAHDPARTGQIEPATLGWHSVTGRGLAGDPLAVKLRPDASRLEAGNPPLLASFVLDNALARLGGLDGKAVLEHALELGELIREGLVRRGHAVVTPASREERAGNMCFLHPDPLGLARSLAERSVLVWGGDGRIRISAHCHNDDADIRLLFDALDSLA